MRPDDRFPLHDAGGPLEMPFDADLQALDQELLAAGDQARRSLHGSTQPTRLFSGDLRSRLLGSIPATAAADALASDVQLPRVGQRGSRLRPELEPGETWAPTPLAPQLARRTPTVLPRARWSLLAAAGLTVALVAGALGASFDWLLSPPTVDSSERPPTLATPGPTPIATAAAVVPVATPDPTVTPTTVPEKPKPTKSPKPDPTAKPDPTVPPIKPMGLSVKACPGGVVLDWTKPSPAVGHYHVLLSLGGDVPPEYPGGGVEIDTATTYGAGNTDGFDASLGGGKTASYRAFAFDADDEVMAHSPSKTVETLDAISLGPLTVVDEGPGSITVSWTPASVPGACFSYGKLVVSETDPDPSYLKGSQHLAAIGDQGQGEVTLEDLPSGTTVWMKYEYIRSTGTGKFLVACSDIIQITYP